MISQNIAGIAAHIAHLARQSPDAQAFAGACLRLLECAADVEALERQIVPPGARRVLTTDDGRVVILHRPRGTLATVHHGNAA